MMDVVIGNCVLCTQKTVVLNTKSNKRFLDLLQTHFFDGNNEHFTLFLKLFNSRDEVNSFCMSCAYKLNCYVDTRNTCSGTIKTRSGRTCSVCNNADCVTRSSNDVNEEFALIFKGLKKQPLLKLICLRCWFSVAAFKEIKECISQLLNSNEDSNDSDSSKDTMEKFEKKRKNNENQRQNLRSKRLKKDSNAVESAKKSKRSSNRSATNEEDKLFKHLNTVNAETVDRDMHLSYQVVTDRKLMFDIPFVDCNATEKKPAKTVERPRRSTAKQTKPPLYPDVIDISSDNESDKTSLPSRLRKPSARLSSALTTKQNISPKKEAITPRPQRSTRRERSVSVFVSKPVFKTPKIKLTKKPTKAKKPVYNCTKCSKTLKMKYISVLHELEHDCSFSPIILVERSELLALKATLKSNDEVHIDPEASTVTDTDKKTDDDGVVKNTELENADLIEVDSTEVESQNDEISIENNKMDVTNEKEDKDATKPDEDDVPTDIEKDTSDQVDVLTETNVDDATDIIDISTGKEESAENDESVIENENNPPADEDDKSEKDIAPENTEDTTTKEDKVQLKNDVEDIIGSPKKTDNIESPKTLEKVESPKKSDKVESPKKSDDVESPETQKSIEDKRNEDTLEKQENETTEDAEITNISDDDLIEQNTNKESPKKQQDAEDKFDEMIKTDNKDNEGTKDESDSEENRKKIEKKMDDNLSPISSDNESNTEANDNNTQNSDVTDNENDNDTEQSNQEDSKDKKTNGCSDNEFDEFTLKLSSSEESNSPDKKNTSNQENESANNIIDEQTANDICKTTEQDTFQIVENLLQNLGA